MLISVMMDERTLFDGFFGYAKRWFNTRGLMHWYIAPDGDRAFGTGAATDADEDMAWALLMAEQQWGREPDANYLAPAVELIDAIYEYEVDHDQWPDMLLPGDEWRGRNVFNPSYFAPHQYRLFGEATGNQVGWQRVIDEGYRIIERCQKRERGNHENGLVPAWCDSAGTPVEAFPGAMTNHQYDSARLPFRLAQDWAENGDERARRYLEKVCEFFAPGGSAGIVDGYLLDGTPAPDPHSPVENPGSAVFVGGVAAAAMHASRYRPLLDEAYASLRTGKLLARSRYYNHCWTVLSLLMITGNLGNLPAPQS
jgi:endo-1,4-beta-D-glucanase Y